MPISESAKRAKAALEAQAPPVKTLTNEDFLSTSITPVNLACANRVFGGLKKGGIYRLIGKSQTGKTFVAGGMLCEAAISKYFQGYELIYGEHEGGMGMEPAKFWRPLVPRLVKRHSTTLIEVMQDMRSDLDAGKSFVRVEDSLDVLSAVEDMEGKMSDGRAKTLSQTVRKLVGDIKKTGSIWVIIQHAKVNLGNTWAELVTTGGTSPEFYSDLDIWLSKREQIKVSHKDKDLPVGVMFDAHIRKNRTNGVDRSVKFPVYYDYGIDDRGACIYYLLDFHWKKEKGTIIAPEFNFEGNYRKLIQHVEEKNLLQELRVLTGKVWKEVEAAIRQNPKPRYS